MAGKLTTSERETCDHSEKMNTGDIPVAPKIMPANKMQLDNMLPQQPKNPFRCASKPKQRSFSPLKKSG